MEPKALPSKKNSLRNILVLFISFVLTFFSIPFPTVFIYAFEPSEIVTEGNPEADETISQDSDEPNNDSLDSSLESEQDQEPSYTLSGSEVETEADSPEEKPLLEYLGTEEHLSLLAVDTPSLSTNACSNDYINCDSTVKSSIALLSSGNLERVEWITNRLVVEEYTSGFVFISGKEIAPSTYTPSDLASGQSVIWGGYYSGISFNFVVTGQNNLVENNTRTVIRISKYSKDWIYLSNYELKGANTIRPFDSGSLRLVESGGNLYIRTCHQMYTYTDGLNHQANLTLVIEQGSMTLVSGQWLISGASSGYVSHSFNQYVGVLDGTVFAVDHGDGYPRSAVIYDMNKKITKEVFPFSGSIGYNTTFASVGGFETSSSKKTLLVVGNSVNQSEVDSSSNPSALVRNIWLTVTTSTLASTIKISITNYSDTGAVTATTPKLVKVNDDRFLIIWGEKERDYTASISGYLSKLNYLFVDGNGNKLGEVKAVDGWLSNCQPKLINGSIVWYSTGIRSSSTSTTPAFYSINASSGAFISTPQIIAGATLPSGTDGKPYNYTFSAIGTKPVAWSVASGSLPTGLTLSSSGVISGTPNIAGTFSLVIKATNSIGSSVRSFSLVINGISPDITTVFLSNGSIGTFYSETLVATGSVPFTWSLVSGSMPAGLSLSSNGIISGTPTGPTGSHSLRVKVSNAAGYREIIYNLYIYPAPAPSGSLVISYSTHVQNVGWQAAVAEGQVSGTSGKSLRLEGLKINLVNNTGYKGGIKYSTHIQDIGWQSAVAVANNGNSATELKGSLSGTEGKSLRLEAMTLELTEDLAKYYDIYYRVHAQDVGWMGWAKNGAKAGTAGHSLRLEALQIVIVAKGTTGPPSNSFNSISTPSGTPYYIDPAVASSGVNFTAVLHIQSIGDKAYSKANGTTILGTTGQSLRLEAITLSFSDPPLTTSMTYETHVQDIGWQGAVIEGKVSGTSGRSLRLEAIRINLQGNMLGNYDVYYRTHIQDIGWTGWAKNGQSCGSAGYSYRMEAIQIVFVFKGTAPGLNSGYFYSK